MAFGRRPSKDLAPLDENALYDYAVKALGRRMRSVAELKRLMRTRVEPGEAGENKMAGVVARLKEYRYLDDSAFASTYARLRQENEGFGKRRVQLELARKGVHRDLIESTLETAYPAAGEEDLARRYLSRKHIGKPETPKETARVVRRLVTAGFSTPVVSKILKNWKIEFSEEDLDAPGDSAEPREE
jgi:regulatory protein